MFCCSFAVGSTYALFTDEATTNIAVSSGTVDVRASITRPGLYFDDNNGNTSRSWPNGNVTLADNLGIVNMTPGCSVSFEIIVENSGTLATKWQVCINSDVDIFNYVTFSTNDGDVEIEKLSDQVIATVWQRNEPLQNGKTVETVISVNLQFPYSVQESFINATVYVSVNAVQANAPLN